MASLSRSSFIAGLLVLTSAACTAGTQGAGGGGSGSASNSASTNSFANSTSGGTFSSGTEMSGTGGGCAGTSVVAEKAQLDLFIMLDQSGSMGETATGGTKWQTVTKALKDFVALPEANGLGVGIQYFGLPPAGGCPSSCTTNADCGACGPCFGAFMGFPGTCIGTDSCVWADYAKPEVEIAQLPGVKQDIIDSIGMHGPGDGTPTKPALQGAINHCKQWANAHPGHVTVVVFATDGVPSSSCDDDLNHIADVAKLGYTVNPSIRTFVIGVGDQLDALNQIAAAGGTTQAFIIDTTQDTTAQFLAALQTIQGIVLPCSYGIPVPQSGTPDFASVNVNYTPGGSSTPSLVPYVPSQAQCPATGNAWYYDDPMNPTQILLCPSTCTTVSGDNMGKVDIVLGCATIPA